MKLAKGPRPWSIHAFAILFTAQGLFSLWQGLNVLEARELILQAEYPVFNWNRDRVIVWLSAWFTITLIPVIGVWVFANSWARILVALVALAVLPRIYRFSAILFGDYPSEWHTEAWAGLLQNSAIVVAVGLLFLNPSSRWLRQDRAKYEQIFS